MSMAATLCKPEEITKSILRELTVSSFKETQTVVRDFYTRNYTNRSAWEGPPLPLDTCRMAQHIPDGQINAYVDAAIDKLSRCEIFRFFSLNFATPMLAQYRAVAADPDSLRANVNQMKALKNMFQKGNWAFYYHLTRTMHLPSEIAHIIMEYIRRFQVEQAFTDHLAIEE